MSNIKKVAKLAGVSPSTVSNVLNGTKYVSDETKEKVTMAVKELDYKPDISARNLRGKKTKSVGVAVPSISNPFYSNITKGIEDFCSSKGYSVLLSNTFHRKQKELQAINLFIEKKVDGIISVSITKNIEELQKIIKTNVKIVSLDQDLVLDKVDSVELNNFKGGFMATQYLIDLGYNDVAFISGPLNRQTRRERYKGYIQAIKSNNKKLNKNFIRISKNEEKTICNNFEDVYEFNNGYNQMASLINNNYPDAVFAINDITAVGCIKAIYESNLRIGKDISIIGFDNTSLSKFSTPGLTTVAQPMYKMGSLSAKMLLQRIQNEYTGIKRKKFLNLKL